MPLLARVIAAALVPLMAGAMHPHLPNDVLSALTGVGSPATAQSTASEGPPAGIGRCCFEGENGNVCRNDANHCELGCLDGSVNPLQCKNCQCLLASGKCCGDGYFCVLPAGVQPNPQTGQCKPYCPMSPLDGKVCYGNGKCTGPNKCECKTSGFDASQGCKTCRSGFYGPNCDSCPMGTQPMPGSNGVGALIDAPCSNHGKCDGSGTTSGNGTCKCDENFEGADCSQCVKGYGPPDKCDVPQCTKPCQHGTCSAPDTCTCTKGFAGDDCSRCVEGYGPEGTCDKPICNSGCDHGNCTAPETCTCEEGWSGESCNVAVCDKLNGCSGNGVCSAPNKCTCKDGYQGDKCEISNARCCATSDCSDNINTCMPCCAFPEGHPKACDIPSYDCKSCDCGVTPDGQGTQGCCSDGYCQAGSAPSAEISNSLVKSFRSISPETDKKALGHCCPKNKAGRQCEICAKGYFGPDCMSCPSDKAGNTCSKDHGECITSGPDVAKCKCNPGWMGDACETCDDSAHWQCDHGCSGHGQCSCPENTKNTLAGVLSGQCVCDHPYTGPGCESCEDGFWHDGEQCVKCLGCDSCDNKGKCPANGKRSSFWPLTKTQTIVGGSALGAFLLLIISCVLCRKTRCSCSCCTTKGPFGQDRRGSRVQYAPPQITVGSLPPLRGFAEGRKGASFDYTEI